MSSNLVLNTGKAKVSYIFIYGSSHVLQLPVPLGKILAPGGIVLSVGNTLPASFNVNVVGVPTLLLLAAATKGMLLLLVEMLVTTWPLLLVLAAVTALLLLTRGEGAEEAVTCC